uniref:SPARC_Ca_bdg domain-containing protein n=1 Tax=Loa loa TaxID=7209 RepID=A0A1I7VXH6_LOALO
MQLFDKKILLWKFGQLDNDKNSRLSSREFGGLRRLVRKHVTPKMCAKKFTKYCDLNKDGEISAREWVTCLEYAPYFISGNYYFKTIGVFCSLYFKFKFRFWYAMVCGDDECEDKETDDLRSKVKCQ